MEKERERAGDGRGEYEGGREREGGLCEGESEMVGWREMVGER